MIVCDIVEVWSSFQKTTEKAPKNKPCPKAFAHPIGSGEFMAVILKSLSSPIVAEELTEVVRDLRKAVFDVETEQVSQVSDLIVKCKGWVKPI